MAERAPPDLASYFTFQLNEQTDGDYATLIATCQYWSGARGETYRDTRNIRGMELRSPDRDQTIERTKKLVAERLERAIRDSLEQQHARLESTENRQLRLVHD